MSAQFNPMRNGVRLSAPQDQDARTQYAGAFRPRMEGKRIGPCCVAPVSMFIYEVVRVTPHARVLRAIQRAGPPVRLTRASWRF